MTAGNHDHQSVQHQWHKLAALLMQCLKADQVVVTMADVEALNARDVAITVQELPDGIHIRLVPTTEAFELARVHGGSMI